MMRTGQFDQVLADIRAQPGHHDFLLVPGKIKIQAAAVDGPIVVLYAGLVRCNAFIIRPDSIASVYLPELRISNIEQKSRLEKHGTLDTLEWLWDTVAKPVMRALEFDRPIR